MVPQLERLVRVVPDGQAGTERLDDGLARAAEVVVRRDEGPECEVLDVGVSGARQGNDDECGCDDGDEHAETVPVSPVHGTPPGGDGGGLGANPQAGTPPRISGRS